MEFESACKTGSPTASVSVLCWLFESASRSLTALKNATGSALSWGMTSLWGFACYWQTETVIWYPLRLPSLTRSASLSAMASESTCQIESPRVSVSASCSLFASPSHSPTASRSATGSVLSWERPSCWGSGNY